MTQEEIIIYLQHKATLTNPSPNRFISPAKIFLDEFKKINNIPLSDYKPLFYMYINGIYTIPLCRYNKCNNYVRFLTFSKGFSYGCSHSHAKMITNIEKFGTKTPFESNTIQQKVKQTYLTRYGNEIPTLTKNYKAKMFENFDCEYPMQSDKIKMKLVTNMNKKYGGMGNKSKIILDKTKASRKTNYLQKLDAVDYPAFRLFDDSSFKGVHGWKNKYSWQCKTCDTEFEATITDGQLPRCNVCYPRLTSGVSLAEQELFDLIPSDTKIQSDKSILGGKEIDIYIPDKKLAIEYNGIYWHSEGTGNKTRFYHYNKTEICLSHGINLIHIFEDEWLSNKKAVLSLINSYLALYDRTISTNHCIVKEITTEIKDDFVKINHFKNPSKTNIQIGLFDGDELVQILSFNKEQNNYFIIENITKCGYNIVGGTKILCMFFINFKKPYNIIFYDDKRYSFYSQYEEIGFKLEKVLDPQPRIHTHQKDSFETIDSWSNRNKISIKNIDHIFQDYLKGTNQDIIWDCGYNIYSWKKE